jgi:hypothetical protein
LDFFKGIWSSKPKVSCGSSIQCIHIIILWVN